MSTSTTTQSISRRTALAGLGAGGLALATTAHQVSAQNTSDLATHPIVGAWYAITPGGPAPGMFFADGTVLICVPATTAGPNGVEFVSSQPGTWEPVSDRGVHFTGVQLHSNADGVFIGTVTIDGYPVISEDGLTLLDDQSQGTITIRDATGAIIQEMPTAGAPPVTATRMGVGNPGIPAPTGSATPTS
jgi:hypothetical protein